MSYRLSRVRYLLWNGYHDEAWRELFGLRHLASEAVYLNGESLRASVTRFIGHCDDLRSYLGNNEPALIDYGSRYRADQPVSMSRAEGCVDEIANGRMAKRRRMRWSPAAPIVSRQSVPPSLMVASHLNRYWQRPRDCSRFFHSRDRGLVDLARLDGCALMRITPAGYGRLARWPATGWKLASASASSQPALEGRWIDAVLLHTGMRGYPEKRRRCTHRAAASS